MFTGLIEMVGTIENITQGAQEWMLTTRCDFDLAQIAEGASIAIQGVCLTVVSKGQGNFTVQISAETVNRTCFSSLGIGDPVNLERALLAGGRLDGHLVQGHVDAVGKVESITPRGASHEIWFRVPAAVGRYIVAKGSVAVDGVSLTVNAVRDEGEEQDGSTCFSVNIIPHTQKKSTLSTLRPGKAVNIETDILGRMVERLLNRGNRCGPPLEERAGRKGFRAALY